MKPPWAWIPGRVRTCCRAACRRVPSVACRVLWATHWVEEALGADRVLVLHSGTLLADGSPAGDAGARRAARWRRVSSPARGLRAPRKNARRQTTHDFKTQASRSPVRRRAAGHRPVPAVCSPGHGPSCPARRIRALTLIDLATLSVKGTIPTCKRGRHMQLMPDGNIYGRLHRLECRRPDRPGQRQVAAAASRSATNPRPSTSRPTGKTVYVSNEDEGEAQLHRLRRRQDAEVDQGRQGARRREGLGRRQDTCT